MATVSPAGLGNVRTANLNKERRSEIGAPVGLMAATRVDEFLSAAGFSNRVAVNSNVFAGGDGGAVEEAPIGYYRFHFWKNDEQWKEHENWIANTDVTGPICVSLLQDQQGFGRRTFYRMLFRTLFGTKSIVLFEDDISAMFGDKKPSRQRVIGAALRLFVDHEKDKVSAMEDEFGALSIQTNCTVASLSNDLVRSLPSSRLRSASVVAQASEAAVTLSRKSSFKSALAARNADALPLPGPTGPDRHAPSLQLPLPLLGTPPAPAVEKSVSLRRKFQEMSRVNPFELVKSFTQVKDREIYQTLLDLERSLDPKVCHFDVVLSDGPAGMREKREASLEAFEKVLGKRLTKAAFQEQSLFLSKQGRVPSAVMSELISERRKNMAPSAVKPAEHDTPSHESMRHRRWAEFIMNEAKYVAKLQMVDELLLGPLDPLSDRPDPSRIRGQINNETFKKIFEGFPEFLRIHESFLARISGLESSEVTESLVMEGVQSGAIPVQRIAEELLRLCEEKQLTVYASFFDDYPERVEILKKQADIKPLFHEYLERITQDPRSNRCTIDQMMANMFQHPPRYALQLVGIIGITPIEDPSIEVLMQAHEKIDDVVGYLEMVKKRREETASLFKIHRRIANCPPELCQTKRIFLAKMAAYEVEKGEAQFGKRLTLFLFSDLVIAARKRRAQQGKFEKEQRVTNISHDFIFMAKVGSTNIKRLDVTARAKKSAVKTFCLDFALDAQVWHNGRQVSFSECSEEALTHYILAPKRQEKLKTFLEKFNQTKHQSFLAESPADIYVRQFGEMDIYFHLFKQTDYLGWSHRSKVAVLYLDQAAIPDLEEVFPEGDTEALMVVQALKSAFRVNIKSRDLIFASMDCFEPLRDFQSAEQILPRFTQSLINCHLLHTIYPPFGAQVELQQRQQLERHIEPYTRGVMRKFKQLFNKMQKTVEALPTASDSSSIYSIENNAIFYDDEIEEDRDRNRDQEEGGGKNKSPRAKSMLGKMFGRLKSPLAPTGAKTLDSIPE